MSMYKRAASRAAKSVHSNVTFGKQAIARAKLAAASETKIRGVAVPLRKGTSRMGRFAKYSVFSVPPERSEFKLRPTLKDKVRRDSIEKNRIFPYQRVWMIGKIIKSRKSRKDKDYFKKKFESKLDLILEHCARVALSNDIITGLLLYMGEWSIMMVECTEDLVGEFLVELNKYAPKLWSDTRIFYVEDHIDETNFEDFVIRRAAQMNLNTTFSPATPDDPHLMAIQHFTMIGKMEAICKRLKKSLFKEMRAVHVSFQEEKAPRTALSTEYNKLLPEIQRLELFMKCTKFYRTLDEYSKIYYTMKMDIDEDADAWPMLYHLTPSNVFTRSPYEANLSFADYEFFGKTEKKLERPSYVDQDEDGSNEDETDDGEGDA